MGSRVRVPYTPQNPKSNLRIFLLLLFGFVFPKSEILCVSWKWIELNFGGCTFFSWISIWIPSVGGGGCKQRSSYLSSFLRYTGKKGHAFTNIDEDARWSRVLVRVFLTFLRLIGSCVLVMVILGGETAYWKQVHNQIVIFLSWKIRIVCSFF